MMTDGNGQQLKRRGMEGAITTPPETPPIQEGRKMVVKAEECDVNAGKDLEEEKWAVGDRQLAIEDGRQQQHNKQIVNEWQRRKTVVATKDDKNNNRYGGITTGGRRRGNTQ